jgi:hypothetical protein
LNKPAIPTQTGQLTNNSNFVSDASYVHTDNNYTTSEKTKLSGLSNYTLPVATSSVLGGVKEGSGITIAGDGTISASSGGLSSVSTASSSTVTFSGDGTGNTPLSATANISWASVSGKPTFATVATSGSYADLTNKPTIPAAQVNADWSATGGVSQILNKPTIPAAQVNADWNATSGVSQILNKPTIPAAYTLPAATATTLGGVKAGSGLSVTGDGTLSANAQAWSNITGKPAFATVSTSGSYNDLTDTPSIPAAQVNADWNATGGVAQILNKPTIPDAHNVVQDIGTSQTDVISQDGVTKLLFNGEQRLIQIGSAQANDDGGNTAIAIGSGATVSSRQSIAIGSGATVSVSAQRSIAIGSNAKTTIGSEAIAIGCNANAAAGVALGSNSTVKLSDNSDVISVGSTDTPANNKRIINMAAGINPTDAANVSQLTSYTLPAATASTLGGVKVGSGLSVEADGTISATDMYRRLSGDTATYTLGTLDVSNGYGIYYVETDAANANFPTSRLNGQMENGREITIYWNNRSGDTCLLYFPQGSAMVTGSTGIWTMATGLAYIKIYKRSDYLTIMVLPKPQWP